jgi:hypothetical protein
MLRVCAKQRLADKLGSAATKGEGRQNMLGAYLAAALLVGLFGNALVGEWWLDLMVGLFIAFVAVKKGREGWRGEGCWVTPVRTRAATTAAARRDLGASLLPAAASLVLRRWTSEPQLPVPGVAVG